MARFFSFATEGGVFEVFCSINFDFIQNEEDALAVLCCTREEERKLHSCQFYEKKFLLSVDVDRMCMKYLDKLLAKMELMDWCGCEYGSVHLYVESVDEAEILKIVNELNTPTKPKHGVVIEDLDDESPPVTHPLKPKKREGGSSLRRVLAICQSESEGILHEEDKGEPSSVIRDEPSPVDLQQEDKSEPTVVEENKSDPQEDDGTPVRCLTGLGYAGWGVTTPMEMAKWVASQTGDGGEDAVEDGDDEGGSETESEHVVENSDDEGGSESENEDVGEGGSKIKGQHDTYGGQLLAAVGIQRLFPKAEHRMCVRHLYTNFRDQFRGTELKDLLWDCARASYPARLASCLSKLEERCPEARQWLKKRPTKNWSRAEFKTFVKCDMLTNNLCESFNKYILDARDKSVLPMLEIIRSKLMKRLSTKKKAMTNVKDIICPKIRTKLTDNFEHAHLFIPTFYGRPKYQVEGPGGMQYVVDMRKGKKKATTAGDGTRKRKEALVKGKTKKRSKSGPTEEDHPAPI
ncbi:unnamed protein product [Cuscuta campestris]|uniref:MULE transposase domain-containing protein n=1 Tax=Cuscuta campestris TaxID=132261 RepID=A0A484NSA8_9ASTE|nr:unnamed protein product [Cuscuta campestris]